MNLFFLICSCISILSAVVIVTIVSIQNKKYPGETHRFFQWQWGLCLMLAVAAFFWFFPYFFVQGMCEGFWPNCWNGLKAILSSLQGVIRIFAADDTLAEIVETVSSLGVEICEDGSQTAPLLKPWVFEFYSFIGGVLYLAAPLLTLSVVLLLFKNLLARSKYKHTRCEEIHIFSELNDRSLALANSISEKKKDCKRRKKPLIIFADILDKNEEEHLDLVANAKKIGAVFFRQDISTILFNRKNRKTSFYLISDDEAEKIQHMEHIISQYRDVKNTKLYIFSNEEESKCILDSYPKSEKESMSLDVIRVNDIRSLIYHNLDENGIRLFEHAREYSAKKREIHAVIVGFGKYGKELAKALLWYTQLPGYRLKMTVLDENEDAEDHFRAMCPEIIVGEPYQKENDMRYEIHFECCKAGTESFYQILSKLSPITHVFVSLGEDRLNLSVSLGTRSRLAKLRQYPDVETVIYDSSLKKHVGIDWKKEPSRSEKPPYEELCNIHIIGDLESFYSYETLVDSDLLDRDGFAVHCRYCGAKTEEAKEKAKKTYYMDDYGFFSSVAKALHARLRKNISDKLNADDEYAKKIFSEFVPSYDHKGNPVQSEKYWNHFILTQTTDTESAEQLSVAMKNYENRITLYPYRATEEEIKALTLKDSAYTPEQFIAIAKSAAEIEHIRWNAYMRAEGFSYVRNFNKNLDLPLKMHGNLTPCDELKFSDCVKDI